MIDPQRAPRLDHLDQRIAEAAARFARADARLHGTIPHVTKAHAWLERTLAGHPERHTLLPTAKEQLQKLFGEEIRCPPCAEKIFRESLG